MSPPRPARLRARPARSGAYALEFALALPILLVLVTGAMDWAWFIYQTSTVNEAAWQGVRMGAGHSTADLAREAAETAVSDALAAMHLGDKQEPTVTTTFVQSGTHQVLEVSVTVPYTGTFGLLPVPGTLQGRASAVWYGDL